MNIFIGNLSFETRDDGLREAFAQFGAVDSAQVVMDRESGRSRGFGFVEMPNDEEALEAIDKLNETEFDGSEIVVKKAQPRGDRGERNFNR